MDWHCRYDAVKEAEAKLTPKYRDVNSDSTSMKVLIAAAQAKRLFFRSTLSDHVLDDRVSSDMGSSPPPVQTVDSSEKVYPLNSSNVHIYALDDRSHLQNGYRSPDAGSCQKNSVDALDVDYEGRSDSILTQKQKPSGKWTDNAEANAAWRSFETVLGTLSRTKESIGRATRMAIDCAKYGIIGEVSLYCVSFSSSNACLVMYMEYVTILKLISLPCQDTCFSLNYVLNYFIDNCEQRDSLVFQETAYPNLVMIIPFQLVQICGLTEL